MHFPDAGCTIHMALPTGPTMYLTGRTGTGAYTAAHRAGKDTGAVTAGMALAVTGPADTSANIRINNLFPDFFVVELIKSATLLAELFAYLSQTI